MPASKTPAKKTVAVAAKAPAKVAAESATTASRASKPKSAAAALPTLAQLQAMPESEYMSDPQLAYFKNVLETMRNEILANADVTTENLRENVVVPDPADRATIEEEHAIELRTRDRERKLLKKIAQAIDAIDHGDYGWCEETGDSIGLRRLLARPTATLSLEAQQRREMRQKMYGD
jgi:DnaK suppressor protein